MTARVGNDIPIFIGPQALFGLFYPAPPIGMRGAVLLCPPIGQDQIRSHRLYRQLANALLGDGYAVMRYDCYGTGDSPGASNEVDWQRCIADTVAAAEELRQRSGSTQVIGFGARLGGSLALAAAGPARLSQLIVWDPVLDGAVYAAQLDDWQDRLRQDPDRFIKPRSAVDAAGQWQGFAVSPTLHAQITGLKATPVTAPTWLLQSAGVEKDQNTEVLIASGARRTVLASPSPWDDLDHLESTVLSPEMTRAVCERLKELA